MNSVGVSSPSNYSQWAPHSSVTPIPVEPPVESTGPSVMDRPDVSPEAPPGDRMPITASEGELSFGDDDSAALSPSESVTSPEPDPQLSAIAKQAAEAVGLEWNPSPCPAQSRLDDSYLGEGVPLPPLPLPLAYSSSLHSGLSIERAAGRPPSLYQSLPSQVATVRLSVPDTGSSDGYRSPTGSPESSDTPIVTREFLCSWTPRGSNWQCATL